jgi:DNA-binding response OmpR family regulator
MHEQSILIVTPDRKTQRTVQRILGVTGYHVDIADALEQGIRLMQHRAPLLVVVDGSAAVSPLADTFFAAAAARGAEACMTLLAADAADQVPRILGLGAITNLLVHQMPILAEELTTTVHKLIRRDIFGAEKYLLWGTELFGHTLTRASQRAPLIARLADEVRARGQSARVASMAMLVADELLSNAVHNAPIDANSEHFRKDVARSIEIELAGRDTVKLRWGCDARYLAIEVTDQYGSIDRDTILRALAKDSIRETGGGAGMGIALAYRSCDHLVFNLAPSNRTEIIALIDVRYPPSERAPVSSYNVFVEKSS